MCRMNEKSSGQHDPEVKKSESISHWCAGLSPAGALLARAHAHQHGHRRWKQRSTAPWSQPEERFLVAQGSSLRHGDNEHRSRLRHGVEPPPSGVGLSKPAAELARTDMPAIHAALVWVIRPVACVYLLRLCSHTHRSARPMAAITHRQPTTASRWKWLMYMA